MHHRKRLAKGGEVYVTAVIGGFSSHTSKPNGRSLRSHRTRRPWRLAVPCLFVALATACSSQSSDCEALDRKLQQALDNGRFPSRDATLVINTPTCGQKVYVSGDTPIAADRLFRIASVTKTFVASVILKQVGAGKLSFDDTADKFVSGVPNGDRITLRMLLQHTSGLFDYFQDWTYLWSQPHEVRTPAELVAIGASHPVYFAPGAAWKYSNTNYVVLGMIAEKVGGAGIAQQIRELFLTPKGLSHTFFEGQEALDDAITPGFDAAGNDVTDALDPSARWCAGSIVATPPDTAAWIRLLGSGKVHDPTMQAQMEDGMAEDASNGRSYGLGLEILDPSVTAGMGRGLGHRGGIPGYVTHAFHFPDTQITIVVMVDQDRADQDTLLFAACAVLSG